jgi:subtilase family serine protease
MSDLSVYSQQFGLPPITNSNFQVVYATGKQPQQDPTGGWEGEEALDIDMAHALAPNAKIVLVEAATNGGNDLLQAEDVATKIAVAAGGGEVSNSWSGGEYAQEESTEQRFAGANVVYFASSGDAPGTGWPAALSNVVSVGGTYIDRDNNANWLGDQLSWPSSGGGMSQFVKRPSYQNPVKKQVGAMRGIPDLALDASPGSGVWTYNTTPYRGTIPYWSVTGGTSVASPAVAAIVNNAGAFAGSTPAELKVAYKGRKNAANWTDITSGTCNNPKSGGTAVKGYDFCTGIGTPLGLAGK